MCLLILCLPILSPSTTFLNGQFEKFHGIEFADEDNEEDIDLYWSFVTGNIGVGRFGCS